MLLNRTAPAHAGTVSAYLPLVFMGDRRLFDRFYTFEGAAERDLAAWRDALLWFLKVGCGSCCLALPLLWAGTRGCMAVRVGHWSFHAEQLDACCALTFVHLYRSHPPLACRK